MNLLRIRYFVETARRGSLTAAAQALYTSQPNLSRQIAQLEQELGFPLFRRAGRSLTLTRAGRRLYEELSDLPGRVDRAVTGARALSREERGSLSIGVLEGQDAGAILTGRLQALRARWPDLEWDLERGNFSRLRRGLDSGQYDLIVTLAFELEEARGLCRATLLRQEGAIFISRSNPLAAKPDLNLGDLRAEPFIVIAQEESPGGYALLFAQCAQWGYTPRVVRQATSTENTLILVETGVGVALLDTNLCLGRSDLVRCVPLPGSPASDVVAIWRQDTGNPMVRPLAAALSQGGEGESGDVQSV